jgi:hypothetical protein
LFSTSRLRLHQRGRSTRLTGNRVSFHNEESSLAISPPSVPLPVCFGSSSGSGLWDRMDESITDQAGSTARRSARQGYASSWLTTKSLTPNRFCLYADSKRKMQSVLGYKRDERVFGGEAVNAVCCHGLEIPGDLKQLNPLVVFHPGHSISFGTLSLRQTIDRTTRLATIQHLFHLPLATSLRRRYADSVFPARRCSYLRSQRQ